MKIEPKMTLKMDPKSMPNPTKGGQGPPQGAPGGDFDSFWSASRTSRGPKAQAIWAQTHVAARASLASDVMMAAVAVDTSRLEWEL